MNDQTGQIDAIETLLSPREIESLADQIAIRLSDHLHNRRRLLTRNDLAEVIGVSVPTIDRMLANGEITPIRVHRRVLFDPHAVIRELSQNSSQ